MSGGKGGSQTTQVEIPQWLSNAAQANLQQGRDVSRIGYTPYYGPDVAALTPTQQAARANIGQFAQAFGLQGTQDMALGQPTTYEGGIQGYSSGSLYDRAVQELAARRPGQYAAIQSNFVNPFAVSAYQDPYQSYFDQKPVYTYSGTSGDYTPNQNYMNYPVTNQVTQPVYVELGGNTYNLSDPAQLALYQTNLSNTYAGNSGEPQIDIPQQPSVSASDAISALRGASDWKTISKQEKINRAVAAANQYGLSAEDLAPVLNLPASTIRGYL